MMMEFRFHGRGGQGAVTAAELLAQAAISEGKYAQGFPNFGPERRGAPVTAFLRISGDRILLRESIEEPDAVIVLDATLLGLVDVCEGLKPGGWVIVNTPSKGGEALDELRMNSPLALVDADAIALETLGVAITNTAVIGALVRATGIVALDSLENPFRHRFGGLGDKNLKAMQRAYEETTILEKLDVDLKKPGSEAPREKVRALQAWTELEIGGDIARAGSSVDFETGNWRTSGRPFTDLEGCIKCGLCWVLCPDMAYRPDEEGFFQWDGRYCKGCGICAEECPRGAIEMRSER